jgi:hypothetical protein
VTFEDPEVQPNDFYYIAIRQKGELLERYDETITPGDEYTAFIGPFFINSVD